MKFLIWMLIAYVVFRMIKGKKELPRPEAPKGADTYRDPVCGVYVTEDDAVVGNLKGERIHFCSRDCLEKFRDTLDHTA